MLVAHLDSAKKIKASEVNTEMQVREPESSSTEPPEGGLPLNTAILGVILFSAVIVGAISILIRRRFFLPYMVTFLLTFVVAAMSWMKSDGMELIVAAVAAGAIGDMIVSSVQKNMAVRRLRMMCFAIPALYYFFGFMILHHTTDVWWSIHAWTGAIVIAGFSGLLVSCVAWPPGE